jgi:hypothetical protein
MRLTIQNIHNIVGAKLPNLDGWNIGPIEDKGHIYEIDIRNIYTLKMVLHVNRDNPYDNEWNKDRYTCTLLGANGSKYKWELQRDMFKTKLGFIKCVGEMVLKLKREIDDAEMKRNLLSLHTKIQNKNGFGAGFRS